MKPHLDLPRPLVRHMRQYAKFSVCFSCVCSDAYVSVGNPNRIRVFPG